MLVSVLDQSPIFLGQKPADALRDTMDLARHCATLGYHRFWLAEHHGSRSFAGCAPEVTIAAVAAHTEKMRIGSGGIMLTHYSPYKVAETFRTLAALHPGRVDLGIGRAPGSDPWHAGALAYGSRTTTVDFYQQKVADLRAWLRTERPSTDAFRRVKVTPQLGDADIPTWLLAATESSRQLAVHAELPMTLAHFIAQDCLALGPAYKRDWQAQNAEPRVMLALFCLLADDPETAVRLAAPAARWRHGVRQGHFKPFLRTEDAHQAIATDDTHAGEVARLIGTPEQVRPPLRALIDAAAADEIMVVSICEPLAARQHSYTLLKQLADSL